MAQESVPPPPPVDSGVSFQRWLMQLRKRVQDPDQITWTQLDKAGSKLSDLEARPHSQLTTVEAVDPLGAGTVRTKHVADADLQALQAGIDTNGAAIGINTTNLTTHELLTTAHGSNGPVAGMSDLPGAATLAVLGTVRQAAAVADLSQTISNPPTQAEVQAVSNKVDELLAAMRAAGLGG